MDACNIQPSTSVLINSEQQQVLTTSKWGATPSWSCSNEPDDEYGSLLEWDGTLNLYPINIKLLNALLQNLTWILENCRVSSCSMC